MTTRAIYYWVIAGLLSSCAPKVTSTISHRQKALPDTSIVAIVMMNEPFEKEGHQIGTVFVGDNGLSSNCSYYQVLNILKAEALANGANLIKVTEHREPDAISSCHRMKATLFLVDNPRRFEREITWSKWRRLVWEDFKGTPDAPEKNSMAALTTCGFGFQASRRIGGKTRIAAQNTFDCRNSWIRAEYIGNAELLEHEQKHFDLSEIYARKLREKLSEPNLTLYGFADASSAIYTEVFNEYTEKQRLYDEETDHGINREMQQKWNKFIEDGLAASEPAD